KAGIHFDFARKSSRSKWIPDRRCAASGMTMLVVTIFRVPSPESRVPIPHECVAAKVAAKHAGAGAVVAADLVHGRVRDRGRRDRLVARKDRAGHRARTGGGTNRMGGVVGVAAGTLR